VPNKINGFTSGPPAVGAGRPVDKARDVATGGASVSNGSSGSAASPGDDVHITDSASKLAALEQALRQLPVVDEARVTQLRTAIEQGRYTVQPQHIADQLMQLEQALGGL
jgi:negative regulator of flagellin synthesis FlgM